MRYGSTRKHGSIHRALYVNQLSVDDPTQVIHHLINDAIVEYVPHATSVLDVGCGVGASLDALGQLRPQLVYRHGVTLSRVQARMAQRIDTSVIVATYHALPYPDASVDVVIAIESMIHSDQPTLFWSEVARVLRRGGMVYVCDDMVCDDAHPLIRVFTQGWHAPNLQSCDAHVSLAAAYGLTLQTSTNLTNHLRLVVAPLSIMRLATSAYDLVERFPIITSTIGSMALQHLLADQAVAYTSLVFVRS